MDHREHESEERGLPLHHVVTDTSDRRVALAFLTGALVLLVIAALVVSLGDPPVWLMVLLGALVVGALLGAWWKVRVWAGWSNPQLHLPSSDPLRLGDVVVVRFRRVARGRADPEGLAITARLKVEERTSYREGTDTRTATEVVLDRPVDVAMHDVVGREVEADLRLEVPLYEAPPSMDLGNNEVIWELEVDMAAPHAPDDLSTFVIQVGPEVSGRLQAGAVGR